jgi:hypothetical protein
VRWCLHQRTPVNQFIIFFCCTLGYNRQKRHMSSLGKRGWAI